jgi:hypothetical protein
MVVEEPEYQYLGARNLGNHLAPVTPSSEYELVFNNLLTCFPKKKLSPPPLSLLCVWYEFSARRSPLLCRLSRARLSRHRESSYRSLLHAGAGSVESESNYKDISFLPLFAQGFYHHHQAWSCEPKLILFSLPSHLYRLFSQHFTIVFLYFR